MRTLLLSAAFVLSLHAGPRFPVYKIRDAVTLSANNADRPIVFVVATTSCGHCVNYLNGIAAHEGLTRSFNSSAIFSLSLIDKGDILPKKLPFSGTTPTTYVIKNGRLMTAPIEGETSPENLYRLTTQIK